MFNVAFDGVQRTDRVADSSLRVLARFFNGGDSALYVADIVQRVEHAEDVHAVVRGARYAAVHDRVFIMTIAKEILAAQKHLQAAVRQQFAEGTQAFPGIFVEKTDACIEGRAAPTFHTPEASFINVSTDGEHVFQRHSCGQEALMGISEDELGDFDGSRHGTNPYHCSTSRVGSWGGCP